MRRRFIIMGRRRGRRRVRGNGAGQHREAHDEIAAMAKTLAMRLDATAVQLYEPLHEGEADA